MLISRWVLIATVANGVSVHAEWSMVVLPDTQNYVVSLPTRLPSLHAQIDWAVDTKSLYGTQLVVGLGDLTSKNRTTEWAAIVDAFEPLNGVLPYVLPLGNHDYTPVRSSPWPEDLDSTLVNDYFTEITHPNMVEMVPGRIENTYTRFTAPDGRKVLLFSLEPGPRVLVTDWARNIADQYPADTVMLTTHINMKEGPADEFGEPTSLRSPKGEVLWKQWTSTQSNLELVLNGHDYDGTDDDLGVGPMMTARQTTAGLSGNLVTEIGHNTQFVTSPRGGGGWLRLYTFLDDRTTVHVKTYSPVLDQWLTDNRNDFTFQLTPVFRNRPISVSSDLNGDDRVNAMDLNLWQSSYGQSSVGDADGDGDSDGNDFLYWQRHLTNPTADFNKSSTIDDVDLAIWQAAFQNNANGDADGDGDSDGKDFLSWQRQFHKTTADFDQSLRVDGLDLAIWQEAYGLSPAGDTDGDGDSDGSDFLTWQRQLHKPSADFDRSLNVDGQDLAVWLDSYGIDAQADADGDGDSDGRDFLFWQRKSHNRPADFDNSLNVDGRDLAFWQLSYGLNALGDADDDGDTDGTDFLIWQRGLSTPVESESVATALSVPEPATFPIALLAFLSFFSLSRTFSISEP